MAPSLQDPLGKETLAFLSEVIEKHNVQFKLYCVLLLLRCHQEIREMAIAKEEDAVVKEFLIKLDHEFQLFLTGYKPPEAGAPDQQSYTKDDADQFQYHCVEFLVFRLGRFYRQL